MTTLEQTIKNVDSQATRQLFNCMNDDHSVCADFLTTQQFAEHMLAHGADESKLIKLLARYAPKQTLRLKLDRAVELTVADLIAADCKNLHHYGESLDHLLAYACQFGKSCDTQGFEVAYNRAINALEKKLTAANIAY